MKGLRIRMVVMLLLSQRMIRAFDRAILTQSNKAGNSVAYSSETSKVPSSF
jgi:hypothetical protein